MSDINRTDLDALLARMERDIVESAKLRAESEKFVAEQRKLIAEEAKITWDRRLAPFLAIAAIIGGLLGAAAFLARLIGH